jgi:hypothetical protein
MRPLGLDSECQVQGWPSLSQPPLFNNRGFVAHGVIVKCHPGGRRVLERSDRIRSIKICLGFNSPGLFKFCKKCVIFEIVLGVRLYEFF